MAEEYRMVNGLKLPPKRKIVLKKNDSSNDPKVWHYRSVRTGDEIGPVSLLSIQGVVERDTFVWKEGMLEWKKAEEVDVFAEFFNRQKPLIPTSAISDKWAWCLATIPLIAWYGIMTFPSRSGLDIHSSVLQAVAIAACIVLNSIFAIADTNLIKRSRRDIVGSNLMLTLGCILVPLYLLVRAIKLKGAKRLLPLIVWCALCFAPGHYEPIFDTDKHTVAPVVKQLLREQFEESLKQDYKSVFVEVENIKLLRTNWNEYQGWADVVFKANGISNIKLAVVMKVIRDSGTVSISDIQFAEPEKYSNWLTDAWNAANGLAPHW